LTSTVFGQRVRTVFTAVRAPRVYEHIAEQIERAIFDGRLQAGDKLSPERQLVREFGTSRVAVREALRTLEHRGLLEVRQGATGGYFVRTADVGLLLRDFRTLLRLGRVSVAHLLEARLLVEPEVARLAAVRVTEADLKVLQQAIDERSVVAPSGSPPRMLDITFHRLVAEAAKNPVHALLANALMDLEAELVIPRIDLSMDDSREIDRAHRSIFEAVGMRDPSRARAAMEAHIVDLQRRLRRGEASERAETTAHLSGARR
jgi:GntR family transcriptional regulator, transcriptional repressor for pyruvate dehydrogenase complex